MMATHLFLTPLADFEKQSSIDLFLYTCVNDVVKLFFDNNKYFK